MLRTGSGDGDCVGMCMCVCLSVIFLYVAIIQAYCVSSYIDFSRAALECFDSGNLNQKAF